MVFQQSYRSKVLVIYCILSKYKVVDHKLMKKVRWDRDYTKYISFKETNLKTKLGMLHINNMFNSNVKFKALEGINVIDIIQID